MGRRGQEGGGGWVDEDKREGEGWVDEDKKEGEGCVDEEEGQLLENKQQSHQLLQLAATAVIAATTTAAAIAATALATAAATAAAATAAATAATALATAATALATAATALATAATEASITPAAAALGFNDGVGDNKALIPSPSTSPHPPPPLTPTSLAQNKEWRHSIDRQWESGSGKGEMGAQTDGGSLAVGEGEEAVLQHVTKTRLCFPQGHGISSSSSSSSQLGRAKTCDEFAKTCDGRPKLAMEVPKRVMVACPAYPYEI
ncbi:hypothetical protein FHG87_023195 [Trinorchestia longiramus]|nr:hypothetical protein FHG87_023195 [Trinorchestia longiramus]